MSVENRGAGWVSPTPSLNLLSFGLMAPYYIDPSKALDYLQAVVDKLSLKDCDGGDDEDASVGVVSPSVFSGVVWLRRSLQARVSSTQILCHTLWIQGKSFYFNFKSRVLRKSSLFQRCRVKFV
uniref:Uncharacterized protein n=1 Tax=Physcomitrium patens TaxID=3218 RepID=A0A2K1K3E9_PHYPA|nr:hypothetical protein PHYPA_012769 [Physcomitrium patens]